mmetsp:Transcript_40941/g.67290  ORF Transcript_40941/g.67290 Transcript_40941/m.67290 type:complete len:253 (-) Transcript_40941:110-868(-)
MATTTDTVDEKSSLLSGQNNTAVLTTAATQSTINAESTGTGSNSTSTDSDWVCKLCTFKNVATAFECVACGIAANWWCTSCTFENEADDIRCKMCQTVKPMMNGDHDGAGAQSHSILQAQQNYDALYGASNWSCAVCTLANKMDDTACHVCLFSRHKVMDVAVNDVVRVNKIHQFGVVRYVGSMKGRTGVWYGVELHEAFGDNNGSVEKKKYFKCAKNKGVFVQRAELMDQVWRKGGDTIGFFSILQKLEAF